MKLTKATLKKIIKEEYGKAVTENEEFRTQQGGDYFAPEGEYDEQESAAAAGVEVHMSKPVQAGDRMYSITLTVLDPNDFFEGDVEGVNISFGEELLVPLLIDRFADASYEA